MKKKIIISIVCFLLIAFVVIHVYKGAKYVQANKLCKQIKAGENISENAENHLTAPIIFAYILDGEFDIIKPEIPLEQACYYRNLQAVEVLLKNGANPNFFFDGHFSPLEAVMFSYGERTEEWTAIIKLLFEYGADINQYGSYSVIKALSHTLSYEESFFEREVVLYILEEKLNDISVYDCAYMMLEAAEGGHTDVISYLLNNKKIDINIQPYRGITMLINTIDSRVNQPATKLKMTQWLIDHGADVNIKDNDGKTAYDYAIEKNLTDVAELLKQYME